MKNTAKQNWFDDLINDFVPTCPQLSPQPRGQSETPENGMDKGFCNSVPNVPIVPTKKGNTEKIFSITHRQKETIENWLTEIGEPETDCFIVMNKCRRDPEALVYYLGLAAEQARTKRREKVLRMLEDQPEIQRAFVTDTDSNHDHVVLTMAIRNAGTCEMAIPKRKYDPFILLRIIEQTAVQ